MKKGWEDSMDTLGQRLRALRAQAGYTQGEVAKLLKIARPTYANYEADRYEPDMDLLAKLARLFDTSLEFLATGQGPTEADGEHGQTLGDWRQIAQQLARALEMGQEAARLYAEAAKMREENERARIDKVDAVLQDNLRRLIERLEPNTHEARREDGGAAGEGQTLVG